MPERKKQPRRHPQKTIDHVVRLYEEGMTLREIVQTLGISYGSVHTFVNDAGVMRPHQGWKKPNPAL